MRGKACNRKFFKDLFRISIQKCAGPVMVMAPGLSHVFGKPDFKAYRVHCIFQ